MADNGNVLLYWRSYAVEVARPEGGVAYTFGNKSGGGAALRIAFEIKKVAPGSANTGTLTLYNLNEDLRTLLRPGAHLRLWAGYRNFTELLFSGTAFQVATKRQGPDITTTIELLDGLDALLYASIDKNYPPNTSLATILEDIAEAMNVDPGVAYDIPNVQYPRGHSISGSCRDMLEMLLKPLGYEASVQNEKLNILKVGSPTTGTFIEVSSKTGLIGIPSKSLVAVEFEALLNPLLVPGTYVHLITKNANTTGMYTVRSCVMAGDSHDTKWSVTCEAVIANEIGKTLQVAKGFKYNTAVQGLGTM